MIHGLQSFPQKVSTVYVACKACRINKLLSRVSYQGVPFLVL
jgi:hypothetical protein